MLSNSEKEGILEQAMLLLSRLERISADSIWAHRASGLRGGLLRVVDRIQIGKKEIASDVERDWYDNLAYLIETGYRILEKAAREY